MKEIKEIKTVVASLIRLDEACNVFDEKVNEAIREGFILKKREYKSAKPCSDGTYLYAQLYAELVRYND